MPMTRITAAAKYTRCDDLWIVTTYFNPFHYTVRFENYLRFADSLKSADLHLLTVECAFGEDQFELSEDDDVIQIRGRDLMWQRERLLNIGIESLPPYAKKAAWVDAELLFTNPDWALETSAMLDVYTAVHPFQKVILLPPAAFEATEYDQNLMGFGQQQMLNADNVKQAAIAQHGHTGYAWAFRREIIDVHGFYDAHIGGDGDHLMAHAMCGDFNSPCVSRVFTTSKMDKLPQLRSNPLILKLTNIVPLNVRRTLIRHPRLNNVNSPFQTHYLNWAQGFFGDIQGLIGAASGTALHLWHGNLIHREYRQRREILKSQNFDPQTDLYLGESGCWEWSRDKPELHTWIHDHFQRRQEDDISTGSGSVKGVP